MEQIYVIECTNKKYYVGKTNDVLRRFEEHKSGKGSAWTSKYKPVRLISCRPQVSEHDENNETKDLMKKYGIENVRGGSYTQIELPSEEIYVLQKEIIGNVDKCYKCNLAGHFAGACPNNIQKPVTNNIQKPVTINSDSILNEHECQYCDRTFTTKYGCTIHEKSCIKTVTEWGCQFCDRTFTTKFGCGIHEKSCGKDKCYRCGREGHYSPECYAKKDIKGNEIND